MQATTANDAEGKGFYPAIKLSETVTLICAERFLTEDYAHGYALAWVDKLTDQNLAELASAGFHPEEA